MNQIELDKIKQKALEDHIPIIMDEALEYIEQLIVETKPKRILEIGTAVGYSAICFAKIAGENTRIDTIEIDEKRAEEAKQNIQKVELKNKIQIYCGDAVEILPTMKESYDMIFIDASKGKYPFFLEESIRLAHKDTLIIADNILYKGYVMSDYNKHKQRTAVRNLREYIKQATENPDLKTQIFEIGDGIAISKKK